MQNRFEASEPEKYQAFLEVIREINVPPQESQEEWNATRAEKRAAARKKLRDLFQNHEDLLERFDTFLPAADS